MAKVLTKALFAEMLKNALDKIEEKFDFLNELDSATGDGDHGTAILSTMKAAVDVSKQQEVAFSQMLSAIGWGIMSATGGSTSSLTGSFYLGMEEAVKTEELSPVDTAKMFAAGLNNVKAMTTAKVGDKTMMDALIPAVEAMKNGAEANSEITLAELFEAAAKAAEEGVESTKDLVAKQGRAKNLGERSRGHYDAGAMSQSFIFRSFADTVAKAE
ncbi:MAG: dihydroxyacetone kinase subunit DhaL [Planctomycetia bacterium]|nr:dihydroxyacetone kinase subunit DhaL [Planctomycetia bacterium]